MTDTTTLAPTDAQLLGHIKRAIPSLIGDAMALRVARAVLAKWGAPAPASQPVALASDSGPSLANDPRLCCRSHPHEKQSLHCQLREVAAWLRWHAAAGKTPSAESMRAHAEQVDAVALELRSAPAGMEPFGIWHEGETDAESDFYLFKDSGDVACPTCIKLYTAAQVQSMLPAGLARVPLTDAQIDAVTVAQCGEQKGGPLAAHRAYARAVLKAEGENHAA